jgi:hypothetical protein
MGPNPWSRNREQFLTVIPMLPCLPCRFEHGPLSSKKPFPQDSGKNFWWKLDMRGKPVMIQAKRHA